ncbi:hypothetical protein FA10DRAFT_260822 [Acaromyces ingoldii]|uniref:Uncharacterized protein n=1 Tax=Acaromyces ingoldii TaxID=215250 RepID=A0A316YI68_9BASI|nr:hypothetical protein FA10DRAFT_260822 [Acaromyces ingoldii]PWN88889.1 hypothetical protein FA10DRAFT_260822 [Acaromyces ingoldii]
MFSHDKSFSWLTQLIRVAPKARKADTLAQAMPPMTDAARVAGLTITPRSVSTCSLSMKILARFPVVLAFIVAIFVAESSSMYLSGACPSGEDDRGEAIQQSDGGNVGGSSSSSSGGHSFFHDYFYKVTSLDNVTIGERQVFSDEDEKQRQQFNNLSKEIFHHYREPPSLSIEEGKAHWETLKGLWRQRSELIASASDLLKKKMKRLAREGEWRIWEGARPPAHLPENLTPRSVTIPPQCRDVWRSEPSSSSHH